MKYLAMLALLLAAKASAQSGPAIGSARLTLGSDTAQVFRQLRGFGMTLTPLGPGEWHVSGTPYETGYVQFRAGRLVFVSRTWPEGDGPREAMLYVIRALSSGGEAPGCFVVPSTHDDTSGHIEMVLVRCGAHDIHITGGAIGGGGIYGVSESWRATTPGP